MTPLDYHSVMDLMKQTPGVIVRDADSFEGTERYLLRNPNLSFIALINNHTIGCVMCVHNCRRGYLQHLLVLSDYRRKGIANALVESCLSALEKTGILKIHIDVLTTNQLAQAY